MITCIFYNLKRIWTADGKENKVLALVLCFSESSLNYNANHQDLYIGICGVDGRYWKEHVNDLGYKVNSLRGGIEVYKYYLEKYQDKRTALLKFKGVIHNKKVEKIVDKIIQIEKDLK